MLHLNPQGVEVFINRSQSVTMDPHWINYDLVIWKKNHSGYTNTKGMFRKDSWGLAEKFSVNDKGTWVLPKKYVKYFR
jgi:hypothetical protein